MTMTDAHHILALFPFIFIFLCHIKINNLVCEPLHTVTETNLEEILSIAARLLLLLIPLQKV